MEKKLSVYDKEFKFMVVNLCLFGKFTKEVGANLGFDLHILNRRK